jgi:membrane-associated HD superfamily phosphohydrolase
MQQKKSLKNKFIKKLMQSKQKSKMIFNIISSIIFVWLIVLLYLLQCNQQIINEKLILWSSIIIGSWFWFDKKLLYVRSQFVISLLLCLMFLFIVVLHYTFIATLPLSALIGRFIVNKILGEERKIDLYIKKKDDDYTSLEERAKMMIYFLITAAISGMFYLIIKLFLHP